MTRYKLSGELEPPHLQDVKAVLALDNDSVASCSRDGSIAVWERNTSTRMDAHRFHLQSLLNGHQAYVNSLALLPNTSTGSLLASGGNSTVILLHRLPASTPEPVHCLIGHSLNVCVLDYQQASQKLISGSWDYTARIWTEDKGAWSTSLILEGHKAAVWGVAFAPSSVEGVGYLTGSADQMVCLWSGSGDRMATFKGYTEPVRSLAVPIHGDAFVSACNDGQSSCFSSVVRISDFQGVFLAELKGHQDSVYQVRSSAELLASCGEDHAAVSFFSPEVRPFDEQRIWQNGQEIATLLHPCQTVWSVDIFPNGDIVTGGSDGTVRLWSANEETHVSRLEMEAYDQTVSDAMKCTDVKVPLTERSSIDATEESLRPREMLISIDISDDKEPLQLKLLRDDDPRAAAEQFIKQHSLSESYIDQIHDFILAHKTS